MGLAALLVIGPGLAPGFVLLGDMVFVPTMPLTERLIGLSSGAPRAVPSDLVVALASTLLPGDLVQKAVLFLVLAGGAVGAARLVPSGRLGATAAGLAYLWNPYVAERLALGQWAVLTGYAALPWVVRGAWRWGARPTTRGWLHLVLAVALGSLGGAPAWLLIALGGVPAFLVGAAGRPPGRARGVGRRLTGLVLLLGALSLPWAVAALTRPGGTTAGTGSGAFRAHADLPLGVLASVLTGGGVWNADAVPAGRDTVVGAVGALLVLAVGVTGLVLGVRDDQRSGPSSGRGMGETTGTVLALVVSGALAVLLAMATVPDGMTGLLESVPGGGLLRDGARQTAPWVLAVSVGVGLAVHRLTVRRSSPRDVGGPALAVLVTLLPLAALPALGWGLAGAMQPVTYPADYAAVSEKVAGDTGGVVVLPFEAYRRFDWNAGRPSLDPLPRWLDRVTVIGPDLVVRQRDGSAVRVRGEDRFAEEVADALEGPRPAERLGRLGIRWVAVDAPGARVPPGLERVHSGPSIDLYRVPSVDAEAALEPDAAYRPPVGLVVTGDVSAVVVTAALALAACGRPRRRGSTPRRSESGAGTRDTVR